MTPREAAADLDHASASCMLGANGQGWRAMSARTVGKHRFEYACGLTVYVYALAAHQGPESAFVNIDAFYNAIRQGAQPDFALALDYGAAAATCTSTWTARLLDGADPTEQQWHVMLRETGLAQSQPPMQALRDAMVVRAGKADAHRSRWPARQHAVVRWRAAGHEGVQDLHEGCLCDGGRRIVQKISCTFL